MCRALTLRLYIFKSCCIVYTSYERQIPISKVITSLAKTPFFMYDSSYSQKKPKIFFKRFIYKAHENSMCNLALIKTFQMTQTWWRCSNEFVFYSVISVIGNLTGPFVIWGCHGSVKSCWNYMVALFGDADLYHLAELSDQEEKISLYLRLTCPSL